MTASLALVITGAAAAKPITGKLSERAYTVIALDANGEAASTRTKPNGKFKLRPPAKRVSLHLRGADGTYAGPVVIDRKGRKGRKAILGLEAGSELGQVKVRDGYAKLKRELPDEDVDRKRTARARKGVPIGAGVFGRVVSPATGAAGPGQDQDLDGIPGALDIDDDGDLVLDNNDLSTGPPPPRRARPRRGPQAPTEILDLLTALPLQLEFTANANVPGSTDEQIESALPSSGRLLVEILPGDSPELDCAGDAQAQPPRPGLVYCSSGGTGKVFLPGGAPPSPFPGPPGGQFDPDGDGFGTPVGSAPPGGSVPFMVLAHGARTDQIGTGDVLIERVIRDGVESQITAALQFVFATVPALVSYSDTAGNSATVSYPVTPGGPGTSGGGPGTQGNGFPVGAPTGEDVVVTLTFWRPQRRPIKQEACLLTTPPCEWIDIGGLTYSTIVNHLGPVGTPPGGTSVNQPCPQSAYSTTDPPQLGTPPAGVSGGGLTDLATDQPASPTNTLTYRLNLTQCPTSLGVSWNSGDEASVSFGAIVSRSGAGAGASQSVWFARQ